MESVSEQLSAQNKKAKPSLKEELEKGKFNDEGLTKEFVAKEKAKLNKKAKDDPKSL